jgi:hypothetical protein
MEGRNKNTKRLNSKDKMFKKQQQNFEASKKWLARARMDFSAFKKIAPFDKNTHKIIRCTDQAIAVYLLQQSIEKATKAVAVATGRYSDKKLRSHGHNSLDVLLGFYNENLTAITSQTDLNAFGTGLGIDFGDGLNKIVNLRGELDKTSKDRKNGEILFAEQFAKATPIEINDILNFIFVIRTIFIQAPKSIFGAHSKVEINTENFNLETPESIASSMFEELNKKLNLPQLSENKRKLLEDYVKMVAPNGIPKEITGKNVTIEKPTSDQLGQWSLIALLILAMYTFPHESTTRYPRSKNKNETQYPLGYEDYNENLGIVCNLGRMAYLTMLVLDEIEPELESIASFYPVVEYKLKRRLPKTI